MRQKTSLPHTIKNYKSVMNRITQRFFNLKEKGNKGLITFITAGHTDIKTTEAIVLEMEESGADVIELGVPFSDPLADGPIIQRANQRALKNGTTLSRVLETVSVLRKKTDIPIVLMSSYNPIYFYGEKVIVHDALSSGVDGLIIPDIPLEEGIYFKKYASGSKLDIISLIAPTTGAKRSRLIAEDCRGFIYYISIAGITGSAKEPVSEAETKVKEIKSYSSLPVAVGFGIKTPDHASTVCRFADAAIVGSVLVSIIENHIGNERLTVKEVGKLTKSLKKGCNNF